MKNIIKISTLAFVLGFSCTSFAQSRDTGNYIVGNDNYSTSNYRATESGANATMTPNGTQDKVNMGYNNMPSRHHMNQGNQDENGDKNGSENSSGENKQW